MSVILGIDTSCDDTGVGVVIDGVVAGNVVASQTGLHQQFGGVMPEAASREHLRVIDDVTQQALGEAGVTLAEVTTVAATRGPGLVGALLVGLNYGRALAWSLGVPFRAVHHLEGHIASSVTGSGLEPPFLSLIASGGHTSLFQVRAWGDYVELGRTRDDAAGEAFDKVARQLGLPYPGGAALAELAREGDPAAWRLPRPLRGQAGFEFSFSGLKTAVAQLLAREPDAAPADVAASFQAVVVETLLDVVSRAVAATGSRDVVIAGGVAANETLRQRFAGQDFRTHFPPLALAGDNGAMIALAAWFNGGADEGSWAADAAPYLPLAAPPA
jgi:N6-L-threonylcarbamoyladenine synthase